MWRGVEWIIGVQLAFFLQRLSTGLGPAKETEKEQPMRQE